MFHIAGKSSTTSMPQSGVIVLISSPAAAKIHSLVFAPMPQHCPMNLFGSHWNFVEGPWHGGCFVRSGKVVIVMGSEVLCRRKFFESDSRCQSRTLNYE